MPTQENISEVIEILREHCYDRKTYDECLEDFSNLNDAFAFDHSACILLLGGELEE
jgi:hypothetical protein